MCVFEREGKAERGRREWKRIEAFFFFWLFKFFFFIEVELIYNAVPISAVQQGDSVI